MNKSRSRFRLAGLVVVVGTMLVPAGFVAPSAAEALTASQRLDLRALVVVTGNPGCDYTVDALETAMTQEGVPYTEVNLSNAGRPIITDAFLSTTQPSGVAEGFYNSVFMTNDNPFASFCLTTPDATATAEMASLANYETTFGVRQVDSYTFPGASVGLTSGFEGSLDGMPATVTVAGHAGPVLLPQRAIADRQLRPERLRIVRLPRCAGAGGGPDVHAARRRRDPRRDRAWVTGRCVQRRQPSAARTDVPRERLPDVLPGVGARHRHVGDQRRSLGLQPQLLLGRRR